MSLLRQTTIQLAALAAVVALTGPAVAQSPTKSTEAKCYNDVESTKNNDKQARELFQKGDRLYAQGQYESAIEAFREAYRLSQRHLILVALANSYERLGRYEDALHALRCYQPHATPDEVQDITARIRSQEKRIKDRRRGRGNVTTGVTKQAAASSAEEHKQGAKTPGNTLRPPRDRRRPLGGWILTGTGAASIVTGGVFSLIARDARLEADAQCLEDPEGLVLCMPEAQSFIDRDNSFSRAADLTFGIGILAVAAGTALLVLGGDSASDPRTIVLILPDGLEVGIAGRF